MAGGTEGSFSGQEDQPDQIKQEPVQEEPCEERTEVESGEGDDSNCALDKDVKEEEEEEGELKDEDDLVAGTYNALAILNLMSLSTYTLVFL